MNNMSMISARTDDLLTIPRNIGRSIIDAGTVIACPLLGTDKFVRFCKERGLSISRERLIGLERLRLFAPVFRALTPEQDAPHLSIPPGNDSDWFNEGWAWDTTGVDTNYTDLTTVTIRTRDTIQSFKSINLRLCLVR